jgi:hypothetical protein
VRPLLDFGRQPICNRFLARPDEPEETAPLVLGACECCGLAQLTAGPSATALRPRSGSITYTEPEAHVPQLAASLAALPGMSAEARVVGISVKDDSCLDALRERGFSRCHRLHEWSDLGIEGACAGVETVQAHLTAQRTAAIVERDGPAQLVVARHIVEHAHSLPDFLAALTRLLAPGGYLALEVPDCQRAFELCDYTTVWEEHTLYFTPATFRALFDLAGIAVTSYELVPYPFESSLVAVGTPGGAGAARAVSPTTVEAEFNRLERFARALPPQRDALDQMLGAFREREGEIALLGAGHLGCVFLNLLRLHQHVSFAVDDNPRKQGLFLPGSRLPILPSSSLETSRVRMCLLAVNPGGETTVIERLHPFESRGGAVASIFPSSMRALRPAVADRPA